MKKYFLNLWRSLTFRYIKAGSEGSFAMQVMEINPKSDNLAQGLAITPERAKEIVDIVLKCYADSQNICETMEKASKNFTHANELFFASYICTKRQLEFNNNPLSHLLDMFVRSKEKK